MYIYTTTCIWYSQIVKCKFWETGPEERAWLSCKMLCNFIKLYKQFYFLCSLRNFYSSWFYLDDGKCDSCKRQFSHKGIMVQMYWQWALHHSVKQLIKLLHLLVASNEFGLLLESTSFNKNSHNTLKICHWLFHTHRHLILGWNRFQHLFIPNRSLHKSCHSYIQLGNLAAQNCHHDIQDFLAYIDVTFIYAICVLMYTPLSLLVSDSPSPHPCFYPVNLHWYRPKDCMFLAVPVSCGLLGHYFRSHSIGNVWHTHVHAHLFFMFHIILRQNISCFSKCLGFLRRWNVLSVGR
jgi:hypothetical protein